MNTNVEVPWKVVVEEAVKLLKEGKSPMALMILETLLENNEPSKPKRKKVKRALSVSQNTGTKRAKKEKSNLTPRDDSTRTKRSIKSPRSKSHDAEPVLSEKEKLSKSLDAVPSTSGLVERSEKQAKGWGYIVNELYKTERDYIKDLHTIIEVYKTPMLQQNIISSNEASVLFSNIEMILTVNSELLKQLESIENNNNASKATPSLKKIATIPKLLTKDEMKSMKAVMTITIREADGDTNKNIQIDGTTTFQQALTQFLKKVPNLKSDSYQLYRENELIEDLSKGVMNYVEYNKLRLNFTYKKDALKNVQTVGGALLNMAHYLKIYSEYCSNQVTALETIKKLTKENDAFNSFLKKAFRDPRCRKLDLNSFLVLPLQRVCKYPLLLRELISQTPELHSDYESLKDASRLIGETVITINEKKRETEEQMMMIELQNSMDGLRKGVTVISPARRFITKGNITHITKKGESIAAEYYLFSDILFVCTEKDEETERRKYLDNISIKNACVDNEEDLQFSVGNLGKQHKITFETKNEKQKSKVIENIQKQILKDTFNDWVSAQMASGRGVSMTFQEWFTLYGKTLIG